MQDYHAEGNLYGVGKVGAAGLDSTASLAALTAASNHNLGKNIQDIKAHSILSHQVRIDIGEYV